MGFGPRIQAAVDAAPPGLLLHEPVVYSLFPPNVGMRQYWKDFDSLERWARSEPHAAWWRQFLRDSGGTGFWHETSLHAREGWRPSTTTFPGRWASSASHPRSSRAGRCSAPGSVPAWQERRPPPCRSRRRASTGSECRSVRGGGRRGRFSPQCPPLALASCASLAMRRNPFSRASSSSSLSVVDAPGDPERPPTSPSARRDSNRATTCSRVHEPRRGAAEFAPEPRRSASRPRRRGQAPGR